MEKIKVNNKMYNEFVNIMEDYGEFLFGSDRDIKEQLELCLNSQGYWSGNEIRVVYDKDKKDFRVEYRW